MKKLLSLVVSCMLVIGMVGCNSDELTKVDSSNTLKQVQDIMGSNYKVLEANLNDSVLVVKTQIDYSGDWDNLFKRNLHAVEEIAIDLDLSNIKELQYWSVCQTTDDGTKKTFACTIGKEQLQMIQDRKVVASDIGNMTSKMTDLYLDRELLQGLSNEVAAKIVMNDTEYTEEDTTKEKQETTEKDNNSNNTSKENNTKKQTDKNIENTKEETKQTTKESKKYEVGSDEWKDECVKDGTHLQEEADKQDSNPETNIDEPELPQDDWQPEDDERYMCSYCGEWFTADELTRHEAICKRSQMDKYEVNDNSYSYNEEVDDEMVDEDTYNEYNQ